MLSQDKNIVKHIHMKKRSANAPLYRNILLMFSDIKIGTRYDAVTVVLRNVKHFNR